MGDKKSISQKFAKAYASYEKAAAIQALSAQMLAAKIADMVKFKERCKILELGCGTGLLTAEIDKIRPPGDYVISDLSPSIITRTAQKFPNRPSLAMDGERVAFPNDTFDLITGNLVAQWFGALENALWRLHDLLKSGGSLALTLLGEDTFIEWRQILAGRGAAFSFPSLGCIRSWMPDIVQLQSIKMHQNFSDGMAFLKHLHDLGAHQSQPGYRPLTVKEMRKALNDLDKRRPISITYDLILLIVTKNEPDRKDRD